MPSSEMGQDFEWNILEKIRLFPVVLIEMSFRQPGGDVR